MNIYNNDYLSLPQQVDKNKKDIAELKDAIPYPINWLGDWESGTIYEKYDGVSHNGSSYIFIADTPLESTTAPSEDSTHWQLFAERGERGPQGLQGPQGAQGEQGPAGQDGTNGTDGIDGKDALVCFTIVIGQLVDESTPATITVSKNTFNRTPSVSERFILMFQNSSTTVGIENNIYGLRATVSQVNESTVECVVDKDISAVGNFQITGNVGPQGAQGEQGPAGQDGTNGTNGTDALSYKGGYIPQATLPNTSFNLNESNFNRTPVVNEDFIGYLLVDSEIYWADLLVSAVSSGQVTVSRKGGTNFIKLNGPAGTPGATFSYDSGTGVLTITTTV